MLDWSDDPSNAIGTEFIIMEFVDGLRLSDTWSEMSTLQRMKCTEMLSRYHAELTNHDFDTYGSLYPVESPLIKGVKMSHTDGYCIGPTCGAEYWKCGAGDLEVFGDNIPNTGPCKHAHVAACLAEADARCVGRDLSQFVDGLIATAHSRMPAHEPPDRPSYLGSTQSIAELLQHASRVTTELIKDSGVTRAARAVLTHPDFHTRNIFVARDEPTKIVGVIDWQGARIEPAFMPAFDTPDFAAELDTLTLRSEDDEEERKAASICARTYDAVIRGHAPKISAAWTLDESVIRIFRHYIPIWTIGVTSLRQELIELSRRWTELGLPATCPYEPSKQELLSHKKLHSDLQDAIKLKTGLMQLLNANPDGYVQDAYWSRAQALIPELRKQWIESAVESGTSEEEASKMFPFGVDKIAD